MCLGKMLDEKKNKGVFEPYLANINVRWGGFDFSNLNQMRFEKSEQDRYGLKYGDLVICEGGEPGRCAIWKDEMLGMKIQKALHRVRINSNYSNNFVYYRLLLAGRNGELNKHFIGSTIKHLTGVGLKQVEFSYPSFKYQQKIAAVLSILDAKINCNNRINAELEVMAKTLYDYWFVQFDFPDENGKPYKYSGGKMVYNPNLKRDIPSGWSSATASELLEFNPSLTLKAGNEASYIDMNSLPISGFMTSEPERKVFRGGAKFQNGDVVVARITPCLENGKTALITLLNNDEVGFGSTEFIVIRGRHQPLMGFAAQLSRSDSFRQFAISNMTGTSGRKRIDAKTLETYPVPVAPYEILLRFEKIVAPFYTRMTTNAKENTELTQLRDWLLPMLMNGQVTVA